MSTNRKKILVVDDDSVIRKSLWFKLNNAGYQVLSAADGSQAVSVARQEKPDLILLDISFPPDVAHGGGVPWSGFLIMEWLRRIDEAKNIPIVVISGSDSPKDRNKALEHGALAFFHKPLNDDELVKLIQETLGSDAPPPAAPAGPLGS